MREDGHWLFSVANAPAANVLHNVQHKVFIATFKTGKNKTVQHKQLYRPYTQTKFSLKISHMNKSFTNTYIYGRQGWKIW